jgi:hypothetical protein
VRRSAVGQILLVVLIWIYVVALHWRNDGLWFQGDAPRHAANGLFWWDFLSRIPVNPFDFALSYYARYPVINPTMYPPVFYLLEGAAFAVFGPSPFVAKGLVLCFTLAAALYMLAWLRRWTAPAAGWAAALLILQPSVVGWSHAVMLNIPAMALTLAALYHGRRWLETAVSRQVYLTVMFTVLAVLTYVTSALLVFVLLVWAAFEHRWRAIMTWRAIVAWIAGGLVVLPWAVVVFQWMSPVVKFTVANPGGTASIGPWAYYLHALPHLFVPLLLGAAVVGVVGGLLDTRWRREAVMASLWAIVCYVGLGYIGPKEDRYVLIAAPALVILGVIAVLALLAWLPMPRIIHRSGVVATAALILVAVHVVRAYSMFLPFVDGFPEVVRYFEREAPHDRVLYDGPFNGNFSFYMRAGDPGFRRAVVAGHKLLYPSAIMQGGGRATERASSPGQALAILRAECGCRWVVVETSRGSEATLSARHLRAAVAGPEFQFMTSYTLGGNTPIRLDIYRLIQEGTGGGDVDVRLPILRPDAEFRVRPIEK